MYRIRLDRIIIVALIAAGIYLISLVYGRFQIEFPGEFRFPGLDLGLDMRALLSLGVILLSVLLITKIMRG